MHAQQPRSLRARIGCRSGNRAGTTTNDAAVGAVVTLWLR
jgi:hypothetical protein